MKIEFHIGLNTISACDNKKGFWIDFAQGEGMEISEERMSYWMNRIYEEDF